MTDHILDHLCGAVIGGAVASVGDRVVTVPDRAFRRFRSIGLTPPAEGRFDPIELDAKLKASGLDATARMEIKRDLECCGLLAPGVPGPFSNL